MVIRRFKIEDMNYIMTIESLAFPKSPYPAEIFLYYAFQQEVNFLVYEENGKVVGYIIFQSDGHVISVAVHPDWRRRGIGTELMRMVFVATGGNARLEVRVSNKGAIEFYRKLGFTVKGRIESYYGDEDALVLLRKPTKID